MSRPQGSRSGILIWAGIATLIVATLGMTIQGLVSRREQALEGARREGLARVNLIAARLDSTLRVTSNVLEWAASMHDADAALLAFVASRLGEARNVYRVDRDGRVRASAFRREGALTLDFPELAILVTDTGAFLQVGRGRISAEGSEPVLMAARRLEDSGGAYDGAVLAVFGPEILDDRITLLLGHALDRIDLLDARGEPLLSLSGDLSGAEVLSGGTLIHSSTALASAPFRLAVSVRESSILGPWRRYATDLLVAEFALTVVAGGLGLAALLIRRRSLRTRRMLVLQAGQTFDRAGDILSQNAASALTHILRAGLEALGAERVGIAASGYDMTLEAAGAGGGAAGAPRTFALPGIVDGRLSIARGRDFDDEELMLCRTFAVLAGLAIDVGRRREAEASLELALREKNALFQELNHRVKNNLAMVQTFLEMGASTLECGGEDVLLSASARIQAIALVHEQLYAFETLERVEFGPYLARLVGAMLDAYAPDGRLEIGLGGDAGLWMGIKEATALGLITNELIMNAFKHAFPGGRRGLIQIETKRHGAGCVRVMVADNGVGMLAKPEQSDRRSMGGIIMKALASQLKGTIEFRSPSEGGTVAVVTSGEALIRQSEAEQDSGAGPS